MLLLLLLPSNCSRDIPCIEGQCSQAAWNRGSGPIPGIILVLPKKSHTWKRRETRQEHLNPGQVILDIAQNQSGTITGSTAGSAMGTEGKLQPQEWILIVSQLWKHMPALQLHIWIPPEHTLFLLGQADKRFVQVQREPCLTKKQFYEWNCNSHKFIYTDPILRNKYITFLSRPSIYRTS